MHCLHVPSHVCNSIAGVMPHHDVLDLLQTSYKCCIDLPRSIAKQSCIKIAINIRIQITISITLMLLVHITIQSEIPIVYTMHFALGMLYTP